MQVITIRSSFPKLFCAVSLSLILLTACDDGNAAANATAENSGSTESTNVALPEYTLVKSDVDDKDARYRVQVGDTLPNEQESIAIFRKVTGIEEGPSPRNTAVYFTRAGFSIEDAHAHVMYMQGDEQPKYTLQTASNERLEKVAALTFDSIPNKKLIVECLEAQGTKIIFYQKPSGEYFKVIVFGDGGYDIEEPLKAGPGNSADAIDLYKIEDGEKFSYKENQTGKTIEVYNGNNSLMRGYKILKKG